jgi:sugar/nucleoside kinase (ribokinase family)
VCAGAKIDTNLLQHIDYLFIADEDAYADLKTMCKDTKGYVILHTNKSSVVCDGRYENTFKIDEEMFIPKSNVLGAGDMFASSFLYGIHLGLPIDQIQKYAHETTSKLIRIENEKV